MDPLADYHAKTAQLIKKQNSGKKEERAELMRTLFKEIDKVPKNPEGSRYEYSNGDEVKIMSLYGYIILLGAADKGEHHDVMPSVGGNHTRRRRRIVKRRRRMTQRKRRS
jgi:hypothetical protein